MPNIKDKTTSRRTAKDELVTIGRNFAKVGLVAVGLIAIKTGCGKQIAQMGSSAVGYTFGKGRAYNLVDFERKGDSVRLVGTRRDNPKDTLRTTEPYIVIGQQQTYDDAVLDKQTTDKIRLMETSLGTDSVTGLQKSEPYAIQIDTKVANGFPEGNTFFITTVDSKKDSTQKTPPPIISQEKLQEIKMSFVPEGQPRHEPQTLFTKKMDKKSP